MFRLVLFSSTINPNLLRDCTLEPAKYCPNHRCEMWLRIKIITKCNCKCIASTEAKLFDINFEKHYLYTILTIIIVCFSPLTFLSRAPVPDHVPVRTTRALYPDTHSDGRSRAIASVPVPYPDCCCFQSSYPSNRAENPVVSVVVSSEHY